MIPLVHDPGSGKLLLDIDPDGATVTIDGLPREGESFEGLEADREHELVVSLRDRHTPVTARELYTNPVVFPVTVQGGREYRVRGGVIYPPASSPHTRTLDTRQYRVIFALQDMSTGQILSRVQVPHSHINFDGG